MVGIYSLWIFMGTFASYQPWISVIHILQTFPMHHLECFPQTMFPPDSDVSPRSESGGNIVRFKKTRCNIITDNFFCSVSLAHCLLETLLWRLYNRTRQTSLLWWGLGLAWIQRQHYHGQLCQKERNSCCTSEHDVSQQMVDEIPERKK